MFKNLRYFTLIFLFSITCLFAKQPTTLLKESDIQNLMDQVLKQHVKREEITIKVLKSAYATYFQQFDPNKVYLLQKEVDPFVNLSDSQMNLYLEQYKRHDYSVFDKMRLVIVNAIKRADENIPIILKESDQLFDSAKIRYDKREILARTYGEYASDLQELLKRQRNNSITFLAQEMNRLRTEDIIKAKDRFLKLYEHSMDNHEERYLSLEDKQPMSAEEKEHTQVLLILKALSSSLDSHTGFFDEAEAYDMRSRLDKSYVGLGLTFEEKYDGIVVSNITANSPAGKSNQIHIGDRLISIDRRSIVDETYKKTMKFLEKEQGQTTQLDFERPSKQPYRVTLKYEMITSDTDRVGIEFENYRQGILGFLTLNSFYQGADGVTSEHDLAAAINKLKQKGPLLGLVLDLRENGGGYLAQAVKVAGLFITNGVVVISKYGDGEIKYFRDVDPNDIFNGPLIILTSRLTASAAEIVAESLQDYGVAIIVGDDRTYGKGSIQTQNVTETTKTNTPNFKVTIGEYFTVSGKTPQEDGVLADVIVPGEFMHEAIGEQYLEHTLKKDQIKPSYSDKLEDVVSDEKGWYAKNYLPTLQKKETQWQAMIPELKKRSAYRMTHDADYAYYINLYFNGGATTAMTTSASVKPSKMDMYDLQSQEAKNILRDMVNLEHASQ